MKNSRRLIAVLAVWLLGACFTSSAAAVLELDEPAPPLKCTLFSGSEFDLAQMRGKVVLINFYSSYCKGCAFEIGNLETFYEQHKERGFEVVAVGVDALRDRARVERMLGIYNLPGCMADETQTNGYGQRHPTPTAFIVDRQGTLRARLRGGKTPQHYRETVLPLLTE